MNSTLHTRHHSVPQGMRLRPKNMERAHGMTAEQSNFIREQALSIFTDCTNANLPFLDCLAAILASGMQWGHAIAQEPQG